MTVADRKRRRESAAEKAQARYDAAGQGRRIKSWNPPASGPNRAAQGTGKLRDRARDSTRNDWAGEASIQKWTTNLVGVGITPRWERDDANEAWARHAKVCDADGVLDAYGMQALATRSWLASGEVFLRKRPRDLSLVAAGYLAAPVQYQLVESDFVPQLDADTWPRLPTGNTIRQGIERDRYGRRVAYWMYREHPGDAIRGATIDPAALLRVVAADVSHVFSPLRPGQLRGVSILAPVLVRLRSSADFEDAVLDRQKLANLFVAFLKRQLPTDFADVEFDPITGLPKFYDQAGNPLVGLEPGQFHELAPGEDVAFANPPEAGTTFSEYMRTTHLGTAAGLGLPYETFSGDIANVSDRTLRVVIQEFRRLAEQRQWHTVIPQVVRPMVEWWAQASILAGHFAPRRLAELQAPEYATHGWEYIHPVQDIEGKVLAIDAGLSSRSAEIAKRGDDPRKVDAQRADELGVTAAAATGKQSKPREQDPGLAATAAAVQGLAAAIASRPEPTPDPGLAAAVAAVADAVRAPTPRPVATRQRIVRDAAGEMVEVINEPAE